MRAKPWLRGMEFQLTKSHILTVQANPSYMTDSIHHGVEPPCSSENLQGGLRPALWGSEVGLEPVPLLGD